MIDVDALLKYKQPCPLCGAALDLAIFHSANINKMPLRIEEETFTIADKIVIWPMSRDSEEYWADISLQRKTGQFQLQFNHINRRPSFTLSNKKRDKLIEAYTEKSSHYSFRPQSVCSGCQRYHFDGYDLSLDFETMAVKVNNGTPAMSNLRESYLYFQPIDTDVKIYVVERKPGELNVWAGKMSQQRFDKMRHDPKVGFWSDHLSMRLELPDFPFEQMSEPNLVQRLDTLLLFS